MPSRRLTVSVPRPCQLDWAQMTPTEQGRFCQSCAKTVVDFTGMSDREVVNWLSKEKDTSCGRFRKSQLEREITLITHQKRTWTWRAAVLGISAWLSSKAVEAKEIPPHTTDLLAATGYKASSKEQTQYVTDSTKSINGMVVALEDKTPMPGVNIVWKGTQTGVSTDAKGKFTISIPDNLPKARQKLVISFIGYETQEIEISALSMKDFNTICLAEGKWLMGEVVVLDNKTRKKLNTVMDNTNPMKPGFTQRIKNLFRS